MGGFVVWIFRFNQYQLPFSTDVLSWFLLWEIEGAKILQTARERSWMTDRKYGWSPKLQKETLIYIDFLKKQAKFDWMKKKICIKNILLSWFQIQDMWVLHLKKQWNLSCCHK